MRSVGGGLEMKVKVFPGGSSADLTVVLERRINSESEELHVADLALAPVFMDSRMHDVPALFPVRTKIVSPGSSARDR